MGLNEAFGRIMQQERFERLVAAFDAACRWELPRTAAALGNRLYALGAYIDDHGDWQQITRPNKPVAPDDELGAHQDADSEL